MKIDFTEFEAPIDGLTLSDWTRNESLDISPEHAALAGISVDQIDKEFEVAATTVDFQFTPDHRLEFPEASVVADVRSNNSLRSIQVRSKFLTSAEIVALAKPIIENWNLHSFEGPENEIDDESTPKKIDALAELENWRENQPDTIPSFLAQSDTNPFPGLWFFRLVANPSPDEDLLFVLSIQAFWHDAEFNKEHPDSTFWDEQMR